MRKIKKVIEKDMFFGADAESFTQAVQMRKNPTVAEEALWKILRKYRKSGYTFRRQHPIEFYTADFYCHKLKLVIEVDGEIHLKKEVLAHDEERNGEMERLGIEVVRFTNKEVLENSDLVIEKVNSIIKLAKTL
jgi:very-short-patch-repair endonuclease